MADRARIEVIAGTTQRLSGLDSKTFSALLAAEQEAISRRSCRAVAAESGAPPAISRRGSFSLGASSRKRRSLRNKRSSSASSLISAPVSNSFRKVSGVSERVDADGFRYQWIDLEKAAGETTGIYLRQGDGFDRRDGIFVSRVELNSKAEMLGLSVGDEVVEINNVDVSRGDIEWVMMLMKVVDIVVLQVRKPPVISARPGKDRYSFGVPIAIARSSSLPPELPPDTESDELHSEASEPTEDVFPGDEHDSGVVIRWGGGPTATSTSTDPPIATLERTDEIGRARVGGVRSPESNSSEPSTSPGDSFSDLPFAEMRTTDLSLPVAEWSDPSRTPPAAASAGGGGATEVTLPSPKQPALPDDEESTFDRTYANTLANATAHLRATRHPDPSPRSPTKKDRPNRRVSFSLPEDDHDSARYPSGPTHPQHLADIDGGGGGGGGGGGAGNDHVFAVRRRHGGADGGYSDGPSAPGSDYGGSAAPEGGAPRYGDQLDVLLAKAQAITQAGAGPAVPSPRRRAEAPSKRWSVGGGDQGYLDPSPPVGDAGRGGERGARGRRPYSMLDTVEAPGERRAFPVVELPPTPLQLPSRPGEYIVRDNGVSGTTGVTKMVRLDRALDGSLGISLAGGADTDLSALFVADVIPGGAADLDGRIWEGDRLLSVQGVSCAGMSRGDFVQVLRQAAGEPVIEFGIQRIGEEQWQLLRTEAGIRKLKIKERPPAAAVTADPPSQGDSGAVADAEEHTTPTRSGLRRASPGLTLPLPPNDGSEEQPLVHAAAATRAQEDDAWGGVELASPTTSPERNTLAPWDTPTATQPPSSQHEAAVHVDPHADPQADLTLQTRVHSRSRSRSVSPPSSEPPSPPPDTETEGGESDGTASPPPPIPSSLPPSEGVTAALARSLTSPSDGGATALETDVPVKWSSSPAVAPAASPVSTARPPGSEVLLGEQAALAPRPLHQEQPSHAPYTQQLMGSLSGPSSATPTAAPPPTAADAAAAAPSLREQAELRRRQRAEADAEEERAAAAAIAAADSQARRTASSRARTQELLAQRKSAAEQTALESRQREAAAIAGGAARRVRSAPDGGGDPTAKALLRLESMSKSGSGRNNVGAVAPSSPRSGESASAAAAAGAPPEAPRVRASRRSISESSQDLRNSFLGGAGGRRRLKSTEGQK